MIKPHSRELSEVAAAGNAIHAERLLADGYDPDWPASDPAFDEDELEEADTRPWEPPLFLAAWYGHTEVARILLNYKAGVDLAIWSRRLVRTWAIRSRKAALKSWG